MKNLAASVPPVAADRPEAARPRVLVVDDDPGTQLVLCETLVDAGFTVETVSSGKEAVETCARFHPDLVLLDINMPGMDGIAACAEIRRRSERDFPIIMVTSVDDALSVQGAFDAGATDFILKPINWPIFQRRLHSILSEWDRSAALNESNRRVELLEQVAPETAMLVARNGQIIDNLKERRNSATAPGDRPVETLEDIYGRDIAKRFRQRISGVLKTGRNNTLAFSVEEQGGVREVEAEFLVRGRESVLVVVQDISRNVAQEGKIYELAFYDPATNLPNRHLFRKAGEAALADAGLHERSLALLSLCFDELAARDAEDGELMRSVGRRLTACLAEDPGLVPVGADKDIRLARLDGNRWAAMLQNLRSEHDILSLCDRIEACFRERIVYEKGSVAIAPRIGVATYPVDGRNLRTIDHAALSAMREAALTGSLVCLASRAAGTYDIDKIDYGNELRQAMSNGQLELYFQPRVVMPGGRITCIEALLRWNHPIRGFVGLEELLPLAKATGLIVELGDWVLRAACTAAAGWEGDPLPRVSVNLSEEEFARRDLAERVIAILSETGVDAGRIELEFTESALLRTPNELDDLQTLNELGVGLVLDDFGTGHSSLTLLKQYPIHAMKIDGAFVRKLADGEKDAAVCEVIVTMAHRLGMKAIAECVETGEQLELLLGMGCDEFQGYHVCVPLSAEELELFLRRHFTKGRSNGA